jgi:alkylhydroperoxidase/carboxymuconolactone decarboxylase family protein YurZ
VGATVIASKEASMSTPEGDTPLLDLVGEMTNASIERSNLDPKTLMLVRIAALASVDAPPVSYLMNLGAGAEVGVEAEDVQQVLIGIAPVVGTARVASAAGKMARALGFAIAVAEAEIEEEAAQSEG